MPALEILHAMILVLIMILPEERKGAVEAGAKPMRSHVTMARLQDFFILSADRSTYLRICIAVGG